MQAIIPVILAGGYGTRLWPLSRQDMPKQFCPFFNQRSLFQKTCERLELLLDGKKAIVVGQNDHRFILAEQLRQMGWQNVPIILETQPKNTAPAIAMAAWHALQMEQDPILVVVSSDHLIEPKELFHAGVYQAVQLAAEQLLVTFGIHPTHADTGYGYVEVAELLPPLAIGYQVARFVEKPSLEAAQALLAGKQPVFWNSGMFVFRASAYLQALQQCAPQIYQTTQLAMEKSQTDLDFIRPDPVLFNQIEGNSIDYAVLEKVKNIALVPLKLQWSDVGSFSALAKQYAPDLNGNTMLGDVALYDSAHCHVHSMGRLVVTLGLKNTTVIETSDVVLVMDNGCDQQLKTVVADLAKQGRNEIKAANLVTRPWGEYETLDQGPRFQVKRIMVKVGAQLSLQLHHHRSEHWVIVKGSAKVTRGEEEFLLTENQSVYIPIGMQHRLENVGKIPLEIIEVQSGSYLGEDDIVRLDDVYGRLIQPEVSVV